MRVGARVCVCVGGYLSMCVCACGCFCVYTLVCVKLRTWVGVDLYLCGCGWRYISRLGCIERGIGERDSVWVRLPARGCTYWSECVRLYELMWVLVNRKVCRKRS